MSVWNLSGSEIYFLRDVIHHLILEYVRNNNVYPDFFFDCDFDKVFNEFQTVWGSTRHSISEFTFQHEILRLFNERKFKECGNRYIELIFREDNWKEVIQIHLHKNIEPIPLVVGK